jgi:hypothetical protein
MPNNQDVVKLQHEQLAFWLETYNAWRRHDGEIPQEMPFKPKQLGEIIDQTIATLREDMAKLNATTPREQELEAQNKALWELLDLADGALGSLMGHLEANFNDNVSCWYKQGVEAKAAIQKAKEENTLHIINNNK